MTDLARSARGTARCAPHRPDTQTRADRPTAWHHRHPPRTGPHRGFPQRQRHSRWRARRPKWSTRLDAKAEWLVGFMGKETGSTVGMSVWSRGACYTGLNGHSGWIVDGVKGKMAERRGHAPQRGLDTSSHALAMRSSTSAGFLSMAEASTSSTTTIAGALGFESSRGKPPQLPPKDLPDSAARPGALGSHRLRALFIAALRTRSLTPLEAHQHQRGVSGMTAHTRQKMEEGSAHDAQRLAPSSRIPNGACALQVCPPAET